MLTISRNKILSCSIMSYKHVFFGDLSPATFNSDMEGVNLDEMKSKYIPDDFVMHPYLKAVPTFSASIRYYIRCYTETSFQVCFYLTDEPLISNNIQIELEKSIAHITIHIDFDNEDEGENDLTIRWISVTSQNKGRGYARYLMILSILYCSIVSPTLTLVKLDDDSDNNANDIDDLKERTLAQSKNLYCKLGFTYEESDGPEMIGNIQDILAKHIPQLDKRKNSLSQRKTYKKRKMAASKKKKKSRKNKKNQRRPTRKKKKQSRKIKE